jgi:hypothetical protein
MKEMKVLRFNFTQCKLTRKLNLRKYEEEISKDKI